MILLAWGYVLNSRGGADCTADMCFGELDAEGRTIVAHRAGCKTAAFEDLYQAVCDVNRSLASLR